jgi:TonB family protein
MNPETRWSDDRFIWKAFAISLSLHALLFGVKGLSPYTPANKFIEVDITNIGPPGAASGSAKAPDKPPDKIKKAARTKPQPPPAPTAVSVPSAAAPPPPEEQPPPQAAAGNAAGEYGIGTGDGSATVLSRIPVLLNLSDLRAILQRFYPEEARSRGREATVVLDIHINPGGRVTSVDIVRSGGADFDEAAKKAALLLRFSPAYLGTERVGVKMRQAIQFKLE